MIGQKCFLARTGKDVVHRDVLPFWRDGSTAIHVKRETGEILLPQIYCQIKKHSIAIKRKGNPLPLAKASRYRAQEVSILLRQAYLIRSSRVE